MRNSHRTVGNGTASFHPIDGVEDDCGRLRNNCSSNHSAQRRRVPPRASYWRLAVADAAFEGAGFSTFWRFGRPESDAAAALDAAAAATALPALPAGWAGPA